MFLRGFILPLIAVGQLQATLLTTTTSGETSTTEHSRLPALFVPAGSPPASGLAPGKFTATFTGKLIIPKRYRLYFSFSGKGAATLKINGESVVTMAEEKSQRLRLNPGEHPLEITYTSLADGSGNFRLHWEERKAFPKEPIPATAFTKIEHITSPAHLIAAHHCTKCHAPDDLGPHALPELSHSGPDLSNIGQRRHQDWLTRWIAEPDKLKPTTTMPAMVDHTKPEGAQAAADIAAYLATLTTDKKNAPAPAKAPEIKLAQTGGAHFHNLGCAACHTKPAISEPDFDHHRIPLNNIASKFKEPLTLVTFLKNPQTHHPSIKMPNFGLQQKEAEALAAYLIQESTGRHTPDPSEFPPGNAIEGKKQVQALNCSACHTGLAPSTQSAPKFNALKDWSQGCQGPRLNLTKEEQASLKPEILPKLKYDTAASYASRQIEALRCHSCHEHDDQASLISAVHTDTKSLIAHIQGHAEKMEQSRPPLTHMGAMLHSSFTTEMLKGKARARPWLDMRMPSFPLHAERLALGLAHQHGLPASSPTKVEGDLKTGEQLVSMTGYACVTCHGIGEKPPLAAFEVQGINFDLTHHRLRADYFHQWMHNPSRLVPDTKMPKYTNDDGTGLRNDLLEGDSRKQFEAIRAYLGSVAK